MPVRGSERLGDVGAGAEAGIDQPERAQLLERGGISRGALGLDDRWPIPCEAEPMQVLFNARNELGAAARPVEVFDPQQELTAALARRGVADDGAKRMAEMEPPGRRRREAGDDHCDG